MHLEKYSFGAGDRFAKQGQAQLRAIMQAERDGVAVTPVWNKSHREHTIIGTEPGSVRAEADAATQALGWQGSYFVDADHIGLNNVDLFIDSSDFFTLDVADFIGKEANESDIAEFVDSNNQFVGQLEIPGVDEKFRVTAKEIERIGRKFLLGIKEAGRIYRHIEKSKGPGNFITEVSMDETDEPQSPIEMLFILAAIAAEGIPADTIAPKFTGRFNKGVDYVGDTEQFAREFEQDLAVIKLAVEKFGLGENLKLSVHSGSDKFSIYRPINKALKKFDAGLHLKTAGTTWLEELIGLALAGEGGLGTAKSIYQKALGRFDELCGPYATVIDIDRNNLPTAQEVSGWDGQTFAATLRHDPTAESYNPNFRQLLHVAYKIAAEMGDEYTSVLEQNSEVTGRNVTENIYERHIKPLFID